jgi:hypothetical protein
MTRNEKRVQSHKIQEIKRQCKIKIQRRQNQSMDTLKDQHNQDLEALIEGRKDQQGKIKFSLTEPPRN